MGGVTTQAVEDVAFDEQYNAHAKVTKYRFPPKRKRQENIVLGSAEENGPWAASAGVDADEEEEGGDAAEGISEEQKQYLADTRAQRELVKQRRLEENKDEGDALDAERLAQRTSSVFHGSGRLDYLGRSWVEPPSELQLDDGEHECFIPKKLVHTWKGHSKGVQSIEFFPGFGHLLLSGSMDTTCKIWDVYKESRGVKRTYKGHIAPVRHVCFGSKGTQFLSSSYDRMVCLWDVESGKAIGGFSNDSVPFQSKFYPHDNNLFISACQNNKLVTWDVRLGKIVQTYEYHLGPVNTVTFVDEGRRIVTSSDDKKVLVWEWNVPVPITYISEPEMLSIPSITMHPSGEYLVGQSMDNRIVTFLTGEKTKPFRKKQFKGHVNTGYSCQITFSPNGRFLGSGDARGKAFFWDWKTSKMFREFQAHTGGPCIGCIWHPLEASKVATCGWDGLIKYWD